MKSVLSDLRDRHLTLERIVAALVAAFMLSYIYQLFTNGAFGSLNDYVNSISLAAFFVIAILAFAVQVGLTWLLRQSAVIPWTLLVATVGVSLLFAVNYTGSDAVYFAVGVGLVDLIVVLWLSRKDKLSLSAISISRRAALIVACVLFGITTVAFGFLTSLKYRTYSDFTFDFGIFAQMYERMAATGAPVTTVERSYMMSHFGVHFSPIFYLFLPGYLVFRSPIYLFYIQ